MIYVGIIDDNYDIRRMVEAALGYADDIEVYTAENPNNAVSRFPWGIISVVIIDENMPGQLGHEFALWIRENFSHIKIVGFTASPKEIVPELDEAVDLLLFKPVPIDQLRDHVRELGESHQ